MRHFADTHFQIAQLCELLPALVESASEGFDLLMDNLMCPHITALGESFSTDVAIVWAFTGVPSLMGL